MDNQLPDLQRQHLQNIQLAIASNPFSAERTLADSAITGLAPETPADTMLAALIENIEKTGREFRKRNPTNVRSEEGKLLNSLFLFLLFHRYIDQLDRHIRAQEKSEKPLPLAFAREMINDFNTFGYTAQQSAHHIAIFFQMRRAFYFIKTTLPGNCPSMTKLRCRLWNTVFTHDTERYVQLLWNRMEDFSTILTGSTGTGKGVAAAAVGRSGYIPFDLKTETFTESFTRAFLAINLSQIPEQLIESELFGHTRGAFTGAVRDHDGIFSRSSRYGSVFLDEIGELSLYIQVKLLKILQERTFTAVGGEKTRKFSGRVIAATNRDIIRQRQQGKFRDDFYYRLCSDTITIPSLQLRIKENPEELTLLTRHLLKRIIGQHNASLLQQVLEALDKSLPQNYNWPGNVRELEQAIRQILLCNSYQAEQPTPLNDQLFQAVAGKNMTMAGLSRWYCSRLYDQYGTYQQVAAITGLDRRTVKKYLAKA